MIMMIITTKQLIIIVIIMIGITMQVVVVVVVVVIIMIIMIIMIITMIIMTTIIMIVIIMIMQCVSAVCFDVVVVAHARARRVSATPGLHNKIPALKIFARGWVAQESICYTINAKIFQGLSPKRRESCNGDRGTHRSDLWPR